jgi:hypothetical protein
MRIHLLLLVAAAVMGAHAHQVAQPRMRDDSGGRASRGVKRVFENIRRFAVSAYQSMKHKIQGIREKSR